jgi:hypothetical protein
MLFSLRVRFRFVNFHVSWMCLYRRRQRVGGQALIQFVQNDRQGSRSWSRKERRPPKINGCSRGVEFSGTSECALVYRCSGQAGHLLRIHGPDGTAAAKASQGNAGRRSLVLHISTFCKGGTMIARQIANVLYVIPVGSVNIILLDYPHGCVLIDACFPGSEDKILVAWGSQESGQKVSVVLNHLRWLPALPPGSLSVSSVRGSK